MVERSELDEELHRLADDRWAALRRTGESVAWEDAKGYLQDRAAGKKSGGPRRAGHGPDRAMDRTELAPEVLDDFDRVIDHLQAHEATDAADRVAEILEAIELLSRSPLIGRPVRDGMRELIIGKGNRGDVALYRYLAAIETVFILALRAQREPGFKH